MFDGQAILEPPNPEPSMIEVNIIAAEADQFADAQAVTIHHEQKEMISDAMPPRLCGVKQARDFGPAQKILAPFMGVCRACRGTFYISPVGRWRFSHGSPTDLFDASIALFTKHGFRQKSDPSDA
jgi:hypothetical protein